MQRSRCLLAIGLFMVIAGCSSGDSTSPATTTNTNTSGGGGGGVNANPTGIVVDAPIQGLKVISNNGATQSTSDRFGGFLHTPNTDTLFQLGGLVLGGIQALPNDAYVTPLTGSNINDQEVINQLRFLQMLDSDPSAARMDLTQAAQALANIPANAVNFDVDPAVFTLPQNVLTALTTAGLSTTLPSAAIAQQTFVEGDQCSRARFGFNTSRPAAYIRDPVNNVVTVVDWDAASNGYIIENTDTGGSPLNPYQYTAQAGHGGNGSDSLTASMVTSPLQNGPNIDFQKKLLGAPANALRVFRGVYYDLQFAGDHSGIGVLDLKGLGPLVIWVEADGVAAKMQLDGSYNFLLAGAPSLPVPLIQTVTGTYNAGSNSFSFPSAFDIPFGVFDIDVKGRIFEERDVTGDNPQNLRFSACEVPN